MGQYYRIINIDRQEYITPHAFGDGAKLLEFANASCGTMSALALLLAASNERETRAAGEARTGTPDIVGRWSGDRIVLVGDWAQGPEQFQNVREASYEDDSWEDISDRVLAVMLEQPFIARYRAEGRPIRPSGTMTLFALRYAIARDTGGLTAIADELVWALIGHRHSQAARDAAALLRTHLDVGHPHESTLRRLLMAADPSYQNAQPPKPPADKGR